MTVRWDERLAPPLWLWPAAVLLVLLAAGWAAAVAGRALAAAVGGLLALLLLGALVRASRARVRVVDGVLHVPGARVPLTVVGAVRALDAEQTRRLRGPLADLRAYVAVRPWLGRAVQVHLDDPEDDTPYWLVGTRRPEQLAAAIDTARRDRAG